MINDNKRWYAVYVRPKSEKVVQRLLERKRIEAYVPLRTLVRSYSRKRRTVHLPLISCYVFVRIDHMQRNTVLETEHVFQFVRFARKEACIPDYEILTMKRVVGEYADIMMENANSYAEGDAVEIVGGNLTGLQGKLLRKARKNRFMVSLQTLGYDMIMEVEDKLLMPLDKAKLAI